MDRTSTIEYVTTLHAAAIEAGEPGRRLAALCADALAGHPDAIVEVARLAGPSLAAAQRRERATSRYRCLRCGEASWNQVCLTCGPDQHPSILDPLAEH